MILSGNRGKRQARANGAPRRADMMTAVAAKFLLLQVNADHARDAATVPP
jgi:hypothetical protein